MFLGANQGPNPKPGPKRKSKPNPEPESKPKIRATMLRKTAHKQIQNVPPKGLQKQ